MAKYKVVDEFTTLDGSWEVKGERFGIDQEHVDRYGSQASQLGGATHIWILAPQGTVVAFQNRYSNEIVREDLSDGGWIDFFMSKSSAYDPDQGQTGPWNILVDGETVREGEGLVKSWHISKFLVIEKTGENEGPDPVPPPPPPDEADQIWVTVNTNTTTYAGYIPKQGDL